MVTLGVLALAAISTLAGPCASTSAQSAPTQVLILYDFPRMAPAIVAHERAFRAELKSTATEPINVFSEYLNLTQLSAGGPFPAETVSYLRAKYAGASPGVLVVANSGMLRFVLQHRARLFPGIPVVFSGVDPSAVNDIALPADVTGVWLSIGWTETYEAALRLQPDVRKVVVITGSSPIDGVWRAAARAQLEGVRGRVDVTYLDGLSLAAMEQRVSALTAGTVILLGAFARDATGQEFFGTEASAPIAAASKVPVYVTLGSMVGTGVVGGHVVSFEAHGRHAASLAARMLRGERPAPTAAATNVYMFDARQLRRWGLDARRVPPDSVVLFDEPSAWSLYRHYIVGGAALVAVQSGLIAMLLVQRSKRRRAEDELASRLRFETLLADLSALFVARPGDDVHQQIQVALRRLGDELRIDRVTVGEYSAVGDNIGVTHAWTREGTALLPVVIGRSHMPWVDSQIHRGQAVYIARHADLPAEAARDRRTLTALGTRSLAVLPLVMSDSVAGLLALAVTREEREWSGELGSRLTLLADVFASALARHRAEQALEEVRRHREEIAHVQRVTTLSELAASLAHEISQPLTAIVTNAQAASRLLDAAPSERDIVRDALMDIRQDSQRAARIIQGLRALFRKEQADYHPVSVNALIEDVVALLRSDFQRKRIAITLSLDPMVPRPLGDATQLQQVLLNVLVNAGEAIDAVEGGSREIAVTTAHRAPDVLEVTVRDTGRGVPEAELEQIFTRFKSGKPSGLGMGLTICRSIVEQHGGRIWATLNSGGGLTMRIELPLEKAETPVGGNPLARF